MKITADTRTFDGTGRAGFCPVDPITTQARTHAGILKVWSRATAAEYARKLAFQERYDTAWCDAQAIDGVWIMEGYASDGAHRYRMTATAEQGGPVICGVYDTREHWNEYAAEAERIAALKDKYATK